MYPDSLNNLIESFKTLPGIGAKTAERLAFALLELDKEQKCQGGFGKAHGGTLLGASEDHVLHLCAPEGFGALLAHDPEDGIGNIGFTRAVGANDGGDVIAKADQGLVREGLKALQFQ